MTTKHLQSTKHLMCRQEWIVIYRILFLQHSAFGEFCVSVSTNTAAFLLLLMHYRQAFQRLVSAIRRCRVRLNRRRLQNRPWSWTLPHLAESWFEIQFHHRNCGKYLIRF